MHNFPYIYTLNAAQIKALKQGRLGDIIEKYVYLLPQAFIDAEKALQESSWLSGKNKR